MSIINAEKFYLQIISRINLALLVISGFNSFANAVGKKYGSTTRRALVVLTLTQFHFVYYLSRPLPNTFALGMTLWALSKWILRQFDAFIFLVALVVVILRFETCLLFGWIFAYELFVTRDLNLRHLLKTGIPSGFLALGITIVLDSFMWGRWIWPEGDGIYFNVYQNRSHEWGTQPLLWYFYNALPRALLFSISFVPFATQRCMKNFFLLPMMFISTYSLLPHKELRFIIYAVPMLNVCAANTVAIMVEKFEGTKPCPESFLGNRILKLFGQAMPEDEDAADRERDKKEREEEEEARRQKIKAGMKESPPTQYDAICPTPGTTVRRRNRHKNGVEAQLEEQYSKITAAVLEKHKNPNDLKKSLSSETSDEEPASLSCTFIVVFILMGIHIWCNVGVLVYASLASWNNYPGGDAVFILNNQIRNVDTGEHRFKPTEIGVYVSNLAAQTGFTRFLQMDGVQYDKSPTFDHVANRTIFLRKGRGFNRFITHDFSSFRVVYPILEKVDVPFLQQFCTATAKGIKKSSSTSGIENVICSFGENAKNCKIMKVVNGFNGIDLGLTSKNVVIKTTPMLWIFRCVKNPPPDMAPA